MKAETWTLLCDSKSEHLQPAHCRQFPPYQPGGRDHHGKHHGECQLEDWDLASKVWRQQGFLEHTGFELGWNRRAMGGLLALL